MNINTGAKMEEKIEYLNLKENDPAEEEGCLISEAIIKYRNNQELRKLIEQEMKKVFLISSQED